MMIWITAVFALAAAHRVLGQRTSYEGHKVFRMIPASAHFVQNFTSLSSDLDLSVWKQPGEAGNFADVDVPPSVLREFKERSKGWAELQVMHHNLQSSIDTESVFQPYTAGTHDESWFDSYHPYEDHVSWLKAIHGSHKANSALINVSKSVEGRAVSAIHIFGKQPGKQAIFFMAHIHAREWITSMTSEYIIWSLLTNYDNEEVRGFLDKFDVYIAPLTNPDGFIWSQKNSRMWRKNRQKNKDSNCMGVDPNRNWPVDWVSSSKDPCAETFRGPSEASEPEVQGLMAMIKDIQQKQGLKLFIDWHSYGQVMTVPYGYTCNKQPPGEQNMASLAKGATEAMSKAKGAQYRSGNTCKLLGPASGGSDDWTLDFGKAEYSYTMELRDKGSRGFVLPPSEIRPSGEEGWAGTKYMLATLK